MTGNRWLVLGCAAWVVAVACCYGKLFAYGSAPADRVAAAGRWPAELLERRDVKAHQLVFSVHPRCPCTRASVAELNKLLHRVDAPLEVHALVFQAFDDEWHRTGLTARLDALDRVTVHLDRDGALARRFGLATSGEVALYAPDGALRFHGGLTAFRGHEGPSAGQDAIRRILAGDASAITESHVFGCSLRDPPATVHKEE